MSKLVIRAHFEHLCFNNFWLFQELFKVRGFALCNRSLKFWKSTGTPIPKHNGSSFGSVSVHSHTLPHSRLSFLTRALASPCLSREPKPRVATLDLHGVYRCRSNGLQWNIWWWCESWCDYKRTPLINLSKWTLMYWLCSVIWTKILGRSCTKWHSCYRRLMVSLWRSWVQRNRLK
jgi:hypothetical protein